MSCPHCPPPKPRGWSLFRRGAGKTSWTIPGILLLLMPKCPICLAAYIAMGTGISIPIAVATWLRGSLVGLCILSLAWLVVRLALYLYRRAWR